MPRIKRLRWAWLLILMFAWQGAVYGSPSSGSFKNKGVLPRVISEKAGTTGEETVLPMKGNGRTAQKTLMTQPDEINKKRADPWAHEKTLTSAPQMESVRSQEDPRTSSGVPSVMDELVEVKNLDTLPDSVLLHQGIEEFRAERWREATESFRRLLEQDPGGRYAERACFLLAKSSELLHRSSEVSRFREIRDAYDTFLSRFPSSRYTAHALVALGHLCFRVGAMEEARGYFGLAFSRDMRGPYAAEALAWKMKIVAMKGELDDVLVISQYILEHFPHSLEALDAKVEMARSLYEMNRFRESLAALSGLERMDSRTAFQRPEISLYLGYNAHRLRNYPMARENLLRFYNVSPRSKEIPLVLSRIGDTYREENLLEAAGKVYRWAVQSYPDSEGALISQMRLAEIQEQEARTEAEKKASSREEISEKGRSIREAYEAIVKSVAQKEMKNPQAATALMRLAALYQEEGEHTKSLAMAKELLRRFPGQQLQKETEQILVKALQEILSQSLRGDDYSQAIGLYFEEKDLFHRIRSPELFLSIARAFLKAELKEDATELFIMAGSLLPDKEKPSDLLYFLAWDLHRQNKAEQALERLRGIPEKGKDKEYVSRAFQLRGRILVQQEQWDKALEAFASALKNSPESCTQLEILSERASAMAASGMKDAALKSAEQAKALSAKCSSPVQSVYEDLSKLFFILGRPDEALVLLKEAGAKEENQKDRERLKWKLGNYYESLGQKENSQAVYEQLAKVDHPLWGRLGRDRMEEIHFQKDLEAFRKP